MWKGGERQEKVDAEAEVEKDEVDDDDDDGEAAEGWKGTDLTSQMQEGAGGAFLGSGRAKNVGEIWGDRKRGNPSSGGVNGPQNSPGISVLVMQNGAHACFTHSFNSTQHVYSVVMYQWREPNRTSTAAAGNRPPRWTEGATAADSRWSREPGRPRAACAKWIECWEGGKGARIVWGRQSLGEIVMEMERS